VSGAWLSACGRASARLLLLTLAACSPPQDSIKVIVGARLDPGAGRQPIDYSVLVVANGKFTAVGPQAATPVPKGSEITSGLGMTIHGLSDADRIEVGRAANLVLEGGGRRREMRNGEWVQ
jgi:hypothetical protein